MQAAGHFYSFRELLPEKPVKAGGDDFKLALNWRTERSHIGTRANGG
jgi:hypothetical protein